MESEANIRVERVVGPHNSPRQMIRIFKSSRLPRPGIVPHGIRYQGGYFPNVEVVGMLELRVANACDEPVEIEPSRSRSRKQKEQDRSFFTPVSNSVLTASGLTTKARQILLILELKAGASRVARLSNEEIVQLTGYQRRTVERSLFSLRKHELASTIEAGVLQLRQPIPTENYVQVYEGVVFHPVWEDWQKHALLFVMSQFRGRVQEFGISKYSLNLYGRKKPSMERTCRIPGCTEERRKRLREFVAQLQDEKLLSIVEDATSNRPAFCCIDRDALERISPDYDRHATATCRMTVLEKRTHRQVSRSNTVTRHVVERHPSRSKTVIQNVAEPSLVTHEKDSKDSKHSEKILESPRFACGERGAISSQCQSATPDGLDESDVARSESVREELVPEDGFASLMKSQLHRELTEEVDRRCSGFVLHKSRTNAKSLATAWGLMLDQLPDDICGDDVELAIKSREFEGLYSKSWGLLLSDRYITRFCVEIRKRYDDRQRLAIDAEARFEALVNSLKSKDLATRISAVERLATYGGTKPDVALRIALLLSPKQRDKEAKVRLTAVQKLTYLAAMKSISNRCREPVRRIAKKTLTDDDKGVREEAEFLLEELDRPQSNS